MKDESESALVLFHPSSFILHPFCLTLAGSITGIIAVVHNPRRRVAVYNRGVPMRLRLYSLLALIVLTVPMRAADEKSPTLVVRLNSIDNLMSDFRFAME